MRPTAGLLATTTAAIMLAASGLAFAGSGNTISIIQERTFGVEGNTLVVDQTDADSSEVTGLNRTTLGNSLDSTSAIQRGNGNEASLTIEGQGGTIQLLQDNSSSQGEGNTATVDVSNGGLARVGQVGSGNLATLSVSGALTEGNIFQNGTDNTAGLTVDGTNASGTITQNGDNITTNLAVTGAGTSVDYTANGQNVTNVPSGGVQVYTNGATVTITQTAF